MKTIQVPQAFMNQFSFHPNLPMMVGCERELFLTDDDGKIRPYAPEAYKLMEGDPSFGYELSACQFEMRVGPHRLQDFEDELEKKHHYLVSKLRTNGIHTTFRTIAPEGMPLIVYPDPTGRYQKITKGMPKEILRAACRVTGTHFHVGMTDARTALKVYNRALDSFEELCIAGNRTGGERMRIYQVMAKDCAPVRYEDWDDLYRYYSEHGYANDPRKCWHLIRISCHGTIEFRMFDNTEDRSLVVEWAKKCYQVCSEALF